MSPTNILLPWLIWLHYCIRDHTLQGADFKEQACNPMHISSVIVTSKAANSFKYGINDRMYILTISQLICNKP